MSRWEPNARERLEKAALELYRERGFDETSVADIAARAGLTERTFFRHFADKREVLFGGSGGLQELLAAGVANAPRGLGPIDLAVAALEATSPLFEARRPFARARMAIIASNAALQERELIKLASLATTMAVALRARGVKDPAATLAAETGIAIFKLAFEQFVNDERKRDLAHHVREARQALAALTGNSARRSTFSRGRSSAARREPAARVRR